MRDLIRINDAVKLYCDWITYWSGLWAEIRGMKNIIEIQRKRIDALEKIYYSTNGG